MAKVISIEVFHMRELMAFKPTYLSPLIVVIDGKQSSISAALHWLRRDRKNQCLLVINIHLAYILCCPIPQKSVQ